MLYSLKYWKHLFIFKVCLSKYKSGWAELSQTAQEEAGGVSTSAYKFLKTSEPPVKVHPLIGLWQYAGSFNFKTVLYPFAEYMKTIKKKINEI